MAVTEQRKVGLLLVSATVALSVAAAVVLKLGAQSSPLAPATFVLVIGCALGLNLLRLVLWGSIHRRYPLSWTYPLTAAFFPALLGVAAAFGEPIELNHVLGAALITAGVVWLMRSFPAAADSPPAPRRDQG